MSSYFHCCFFICDFACCYAQYAEKLMHILHKKSAYPYSNLKFFLRPFYVFSTSFLRNRYYEAGRLNILYILHIGWTIWAELCIWVAYVRKML